MSEIAIPPPNSGPEPPGLMDAVRRFFGGGAPSPPDPYAALGSPAGALKLLSDTRSYCDPGREVFEQVWWRILSYFNSRQWIYWNPSTRSIEDKRLAKWIPKPVTNKIRETYDAIFALLSDITPGVQASPVGHEPKNIIAAQTADEIMPLVHDEHQMSRRMAAADFWAILLGNAFLHPYWDKDDPTHTELVPLWQCQLCQTVAPPDAIQAAGNACPNCHSRALAPAMDPATGQPQTQKVVLGRGKTLVFSPLEVLLPLYAQSFEAVDRLIALAWLPRHVVEELAPTAAKQVQWGKTPAQRTLQMYRSLAMQTDLPVTPSSWQTTSMSTETEGCTVQYLWIKAGKQYDQGVYLPFLGDGDAAIPAYELVEQGPEGTARPTIPHRTVKDEAMWPWIHYPYRTIEGRLYAQGAVDNLLQKQDQINQIDSMTQLVANRMGNPIWLEPKGSEVERFTGEPGLVVKWQPVGAQGAKPERIAGENPPQSFFALRQQFLGDLEDLAGTYDVVKGSKPSGVEAFSALNLLVERSQSRFTPVFKNRGETYRQWASLVIELERVHGPGQRVRNLLGPNQNWTQKIFKQSDLQGDITILVEDGSNVPKTALGRRAAIEHGSQLGLLAPQQNPDQMYAMMQEIGISNLVPALDADVKSALQEQQAFEEWAAAGFAGPSPLQRLPWHNDQVHLSENRKWMNSDRVREILMQAGPRATQVVQLLAQHLMEHQQAVMAMQAAQAAAAEPAHPPQGGGSGGSQPGGRGRDGGGVGAGRAAHDSNAQSSAAPHTPQGNAA